MTLTRYQMLIDGQWCDAADGQFFQSLNPSTGEAWCEVPQATAEDVDRAVQAAHRACFSGPWSKLTATQRGQKLYALGDLLAQAASALGSTECTDTGKMFKETQWQSSYVAEYFRYFGGLADKVVGDTLPIDKADMFVFTQREPVGVIAAIVPWNSQLFLSATKIGPALAAGNSIVLKASEHASASMLEFGRLIEEAGIPPGVVNIVTGFGEPCGKTLTSHKLVSKIAFTGGPVSARHIIENSAENFAQLSLELGGKSPILVFDDAQIDSAVNGAISGIFGASGQSCVSGSRLYVQDSIYDEFIAKLLSITEGIKVGDPHQDETEMGPLCTLAQLERTEAQIQKALEQGARLLTGGQRPAGMSGYYFLPTILECDQQMEIVDTELFSPVLCVSRFSDEAQAIELANDTEHGLAAGIFTTNGARGLRVSSAIRAGIVWVNTYRAISPIAPFGGYKNSGYGREAGLQSIYDYSRPKTVWINTSDEPLANQFVSR